ncbi:Holliday junction branch migration protein RuvA, partial [Proteus mirabilis]|nr:Holliday junction branch migration protein RuvA [Proteus mirabilis]
IEAEASAALIALGYKQQEAAKMSIRVATAGADSETLIKEA